jgi:mRNA interferase RelE/StbE
MFNIELSKQSSKFLRKCEEELRVRVVKKLRLLREEPFSHDSKQLEGYDKPTFRIRVGKYRIIYEINNEEKLILISKIDKREKVY